MHNSDEDIILQARCRRVCIKLTKCIQPLHMAILMRDCTSKTCTVCGTKQKMIRAWPLTLEALFIMDAMQIRPDSSWSATCITDRNVHDLDGTACRRHWIWAL